MLTCGMGDMTPIELSAWAYERIIQDLVERHGTKALLMGYKKTTLGWTPRMQDRWGKHRRVHIDFWEESAKSLFLLEYSQYLSR